MQTLSSVDFLGSFVKKHCMEFDFLPSIINRKIENAMSSSLMTDFAIGTVEQVDPPNVRLDAKTILTEDMLFLFPFVKAWDIEATDEDSGQPFNFKHTHVIQGETEAAGEGPHTHRINIVSEPALLNIQVWRNLRVGDGVLMLRCQGGSRFLLLTRLDGFTNTPEEVA